MKKLNFHKYHALGNDFIIIDLLSKRSINLDFNALSKKICDRKFGIGADGILVLTRSKMADCCIDVFNSDGSWAEKSGNGLRIVAAYFHRKYSRKKKLAFEIAGDIASVRIEKASKHQYSVKVSLGQPQFETKKIPMKSKLDYHINAPLEIDGTKFPATVLSVGNPHTVIFVDNFNFEWQRLGEIIENSRHFPHRTNVEFVQIVNRHKVILNDWERGAGETGSSGTGASAAVAAGIVTGLLDRKAEVVFPSGSLFVEWSQSDDIIYLTGPVEYVASGEFFFNPGK